jgi:hypothetical protein
VSKQILIGLLALARVAAAEVEKETGEAISGRLDLKLDDDLPSTTVPSYSQPGVYDFNAAGFSKMTDALGRVRFAAVDAFIAECTAIDPVRAARIPCWFYFGPAFEGPNAAKFPNDDARELAWLNMDDRFWIHPYLNMKKVYGRRYVREQAPKNRPIPQSMLGWVAVETLVDTKPYDYGFTDATQPLRDAQYHWENLSREPAVEAV